MCLTMHFRGLSPNMDINLDLTNFSRAMDCDLRQQGGDKKHKNREDFSQNVGLHKILLLYSHLFNNFYRTVPSAWETCEVREDSGYVGQERAAGHHHEDRGAAEEQPAGDTIIILNTGATTHLWRQARQDLVQLKVEIDEFMESVLANPENQVGFTYWIYINIKHYFTCRTPPCTQPEICLQQIHWTWKTFLNHPKCQW